MACNRQRKYYGGKKILSKPQYSSMKPNDLSQARLDKVKRLGCGHQSCLWLLGWRMFSSSAVQHRPLQQNLWKGHHKSSFSAAWGVTAAFSSLAYIEDWCTHFTQLSKALLSNTFVIKNFLLHKTVIHYNGACLRSIEHIAFVQFTAWSNDSEV